MCKYLYITLIFNNIFILLTFINTLLIKMKYIKYINTIIDIFHFSGSLRF